MALADRLVNTERKSAFETWLDTLTPSNRDVVTVWLKDRSISHARIALMIRDDSPEDGFVGYRADGTTISNWRRVHAR